jgi:hypothetical protein
VGGKPPGETPNEGHKLVQVFGASPTDGRAERNNRETEHVLLPLDEEVLLPAPGEETVLHDPDSWEKLQRGR